MLQLSNEAIAIFLKFNVLITFMAQRIGRMFLLRDVVSHAYRCFKSTWASFFHFQRSSNGYTFISCHEMFQGIHPLNGDTGSYNYYAHNLFHYSTLIQLFVCCYVLTDSIFQNAPQFHHDDLKRASQFYHYNGHSNNRRQ